LSDYTDNKSGFIGFKVKSHVFPLVVKKLERLSSVEELPELGDLRIAFLPLLSGPFVQTFDPVLKVGLNTHPPLIKNDFQLGLNSLFDGVSLFFVGTGAIASVPIRAPTNATHGSTHFIGLSLDVSSSGSRSAFSRSFSARSRAISSRSFQDSSKIHALLM
jgi:hypothetical protein